MATIVKLNGREFEFSHQSTLKPQKSCYDLELVEPDFDKETAKQIAGGVDANVVLPSLLESTVVRTSLKPVAKIFEDENGNKKFTAYFD